MTNFDFLGIPVAPPPPPIDPLVAREEKIANDTRVESDLNNFISAKLYAQLRKRMSGRECSYSSPV